MLLIVHMGSAIAILPVTVALFVVAPEHLWIPGLWVVAVVVSLIASAASERRHQQRRNRHID